MASIASASPSSRHSFPCAESADDSDSWQYVESNPPSVGFIHSPTSSSMNSWGVVGYPQHLQASPASMPDQHLDHEHHQHVHLPPVPYPDHTNPSMMTSTGPADATMMTSFDDQSFMDHPFIFTPEQLANAVDIAPYYAPFQGSMPDMQGLDAFDMTSQPIDLGIPEQYRTGGNVSPWAPTNLKSDEMPQTVMVDESHSFISTTPPQASPSHDSRHSSPQSPAVKVELSKSASPIRKVRGNSKVEKKKSSSSPSAAPADPSSKFVIMTPNLINQQAGKPNPFECFEALRTTQRGRKGPLANDIKESALHVRRRGACFCCRSRKVKCDEERPCSKCKKLSAQVPQIMCWQFGDFLPILFPDFIRGHFKKEQMASFLSDHVERFGISGGGGGADMTMTTTSGAMQGGCCTVELFSGQRFASTLTVPASFFVPKTAEILQHWHMNVGVNQMDLQAQGAAPIGIDPAVPSQREELRRRAKEYIQNLTQEPQYAEQVTDAMRSTQIPRKVLGIVQRYAQLSNSPIVKRALSIYVTHYVLTRQLCLTADTIARLQPTHLVPHNDVPFLTARVLNRQVKAALDELLLKDVQALFDGFSRSLKPKSRAGWAPCLAAFLVLCLFMEAIETAADVFVVSQNEIAYRNRARQPGAFRRRDLVVARDIENMPFKQLAYQFHQVYQTHARDAAVRAFNPLVDDDLLAELDRPTLDMVLELRGLLEGDGWHELDFLVADPILTSQEAHPYPRDVSLDYTGHLLARFLLSFQDEKYLFDGQY
ncbi:hypothetical protein F4778DRAFT_734919 [Xylariomycetidae sp. FL2044]|nr:hypothetical protein F4778DRAFT_734919 [Xylariomycetidae sp. FL2044]